MTMANRSLNLIFCGLLLGASSISHAAAKKSCEELLQGKSLIQSDLSLDDGGSALIKRYNRETSKAAVNFGKDSEFFDQVARVLQLVEDKDRLKVLEKELNWKLLGEIPVDQDNRLMVRRVVPNLSLMGSKYVNSNDSTGRVKSYLFRNKTTLFVVTAFLSENRETKGQVIGAEIIQVDNFGRTDEKHMVFGVTKPKLSDYSELAELIKQHGAGSDIVIRKMFNPDPVGSGSGLSSAILTNKTLGIIIGYLPEAYYQADESYLNWKNIEDAFLQLGPKLDVREILADISKLHQEQLRIRGGNLKYSSFYYDDRGTVGIDKIRASDKLEISRARQGAFYRIKEYGGVHLLVQAPDSLVPNSTIEVIVWSDDFKSKEVYYVPLDSSGIAAVQSNTSRFLPIIYRLLLSTRANLKERNQELRSEQE